MPPRPLPLRLSLWVARTASRLAPKGHQEELRGNWEAELIYHWQQEVRAPGAFFLWSLGAFRHAWYLLRTEYSMDNIWHDIRYGLRSLNRNRGIMILACLSLAMGIGASTAVFSVAEAVFLRPLPYPEAHRLVDISHRTRGTNRLSVHRLDVVELQEEAGIFEDVGGRAMIPSDLTFQAGDGWAIHASLLAVTHNYFDILGVEAALGRTFVLDDALIDPRVVDETGLPRVPGVVITHGLWQRAFGENPDLDGMSLRIGEISLDVLGVLPPDFELLHEQVHRWIKGTGTEVFAPYFQPRFAEPASRGGPGNRGIRALGRLQPGVTYEQAQSAMDVIAARLRAEHPAHENEELQVLIYPLRQDITAWSRRSLFVLVGGVAFLMLLVCANVANLQLVRGRIRAGEYAVQAALGCGRMRLFGQRLWESLLLALVGGGIGVALAWGAIRGVEILAPRNVPLLNHVELNVLVLIFGFGAALFFMLIAGLLPAYQTCRLHPALVLNRESRGSGAAGRRRLMNTLVVSGLALSMVLLSGAVIMVRTLVGLNRADLGFEPEGIVSFELNVPRGPDPDPDARATIFRQLEEQLSVIPGVEAVARTNGIPLGEGVGNTTYGWSQEVFEQQTERGEVIISTTGYLETMGTRLLAGRYFNPTDVGGPVLPVIVDQQLAELAWPGGDPIGKQLIFWRRAQEAVVVGVVENMLFRDFGMRSFEAIHVPESAVGPGAASTFVLRTRPGTTGLATSIRQAVQMVDPSLEPWQVRALSDRVKVSMGPTRFVLFLMGAFAVVALAVGVVGLFGVIAHTVRTRTAELGIRMALGAEGGRVLAMVLRQATVLTLIGVLAGTGATLALARFLRSVAIGVSPTDPMTLAATALTLAVVSILACAAPARWASKVDPVRALRGE